MRRVELHLAYRWFCRLGLEDKVPNYLIFSVMAMVVSVKRHFPPTVRGGGEGVHGCWARQGRGVRDRCQRHGNHASRYHGKAPGEIDWSVPERQTRAVAEFLSGLDNEDTEADRKLPKVISLSDPCAAWTAKANKRVQFGYGLNYMVDVEHAVIVDVEATPARTYEEVAATKTMIDRTETAFSLKPKRLTADTAYGTGKLLAWLLDKDITPHIPVWERYERTDGMFSRRDFTYDAARDCYICPNGRSLRTSGNSP